MERRLKAIANLEVEMSKLFKTPASRLICVGGAKVSTNAPGGVLVPESDIGPYFN